MLACLTLALTEFLAQAPPAPAPIVAPSTPAPPGTPSAPLFDNLFLWTIGIIFISAIIGTVIRLRTRDKALRLFDDYHVTYLAVGGQSLWGDLLVFSQGLELRFDAPYRTRRGLVKNSALIYQTELATCLAICRTVDGLTEQELKDRRRQIHKTFNPNFFRRTLRWFLNLFGTIRDAVAKAFSAFIGQVAKANPANAVLVSQRGGMDQIGQTLITAVPYAYEPMLEKHIGKPVVLEMFNPTDPQKRMTEFPGYLAEYSDRFVAVFNVDHTPVESLELTVEKEAVLTPALKVDIEPTQVRLTCMGPEALVVKQAKIGDQTSDLEVVLIVGMSLPLSRPADSPVTFWIDRTQHIDIICPRTNAFVRFGGMTVESKRANFVGLAPEQESEGETSILHRDALELLRGLRSNLRFMRDENEGGNGK